MEKRITRAASSFDKLTAAEKERVYRKIDESPPGKLWAEAQSRPLTAADRKRFDKIRKKMGRP